MKKIIVTVWVAFLFLLVGKCAFSEGFNEYNKTQDGTIIVSDGGDTITVDGTISTTQSTTPWLISKQYQICNKDDDATPNYYGFEASDGSWYIMRWTVSAGADVFEYSKGSSNYSTGWTGRVGLSYAGWGDTF